MEFTVKAATAATTTATARTTTATKEDAVENQLSELHNQLLRQLKNIPHSIESGINEITPYTFLQEDEVIFSCHSPTSSRHITFKVRQADKCIDGRLRFFVGLLTGPENNIHYSYCGMLDIVRGELILTSKSAFGASSKTVEAFNWILDRIYRRKVLPKGCLILKAIPCIRCGNLLTVPKSILAGYGPYCVRFADREKEFYEEET